MKNHWISLSNIYSEKDYMQVRGYLRFSVSVLHEDDKRIELKPGENSDSMITSPPHIKPSYLQMNIYIFKAEEVPDMDSLRETKTNRQCDGFITMNFLGKKLSTSTRQMKGNVIIWNEAISIPLMLPLTSDKMVFVMYDEDTVGNDIVGSFEISANQIIDGLWKKPRYIAIYGAPVNCSGENTNLMNENPEIGSNWKGRVLIQIESKETEEPKMGISPIAQENPILQIVGSLRREALWQIKIEVIDVLFLPWEDSSISLVFGLEEHVTISPQRTIKKWNIRKWKLKRKITFYNSSYDYQDVSDLMIYLCKGKDTGVKDRIVFQRIPPKEIYKNKDTLVLKLIPDPSVGAVSESRILLKVKINLECMNSEQNIKKEDIDQDEEDDEEADDEQVMAKAEVEDSDSDMDLDAEFADYKKKYEKKKNKIATKVGLKKSHTVICNVFMSKEFVSGDSGGTSDLYVKVGIHEQTRQTTVKYDLVNAVWNESLIFPALIFDKEDKSKWPIAYITVHDKDPLQDDLLGYSYVWLCNSSHQFNSLEKLTPKWHQFNLPTSNRPQGQLLMSFFILDDDNKQNTKLFNSLESLDIT